MHARIRHRRRNGMVLILVLVVVALLSLAAFTYSELMLTEHKAARMSGRQAQARALADSGLEVVKQFLSQTPEAQQEAGGVYDNPTHLHGLLVIDGAAAKGRGYSSIVAPKIADGQLGGVRAGLEDESTRLNLNTLLAADKTVEGGGRQLLMALPGMTVDVADAILDWLDSDDEPREYGAEVDYYSSLSPAYAPKNGSLDTVEELLLVRGVTPELLFGTDTNHNGQVDPGEQPQADSNGGEDTSRGWSAYLTLYSYEANVRPDGTPRINLNADDLEQLHSQLSEAFTQEWANFIIAYRQSGPYTGNSKKSESPGNVDMDFTQQGKVKFATVLDLVGSKTTIKVKGEDEPVPLETPFSSEPVAMAVYLPLLFDHATANKAPLIPGRINVNQASRTVLMGIPGMTEDIVEEIISRRNPEATEDSQGRRHESWLVAEGIVTLDEMKQLLPLVNAGGNVYRAQVVGYFEEGGPAARIEAVVDATTKNPRIVFWRDLSHLGRGYRVETLGLEARE